MTLLANLIAPARAQRRRIDNRFSRMREVLPAGSMATLAAYRNLCERASCVEHIARTVCVDASGVAEKTVRGHPSSETNVIVDIVTGRHVPTRNLRVESYRGLVQSVAARDQERAGVIAR